MAKSNQNANQLKTYLNWSSGKDAALALHYLQQNEGFDVSKLVTTINEHHDRVSMHGLRRELLLEQIKSIGIAHTTVELPAEPSMEDYNQIMKASTEILKNEGYTDCAFGDIFLEDLRSYREEQLSQQNIKAHFPLWKKDTKQLLKDFLSLGFKAIVICINAQLLDESFLGREIDKNFINDLPPNVDPCGENGEFHTFCFDGPIFNYPITFQKGEIVYREYNVPKKDCELPASDSMKFGFCDLTLKKIN